MDRININSKKSKYTKSDTNRRHNMKGKKERGYSVVICNWDNETPEEFRERLLTWLKALKEKKALLKAKK